MSISASDPMRRASSFVPMPPPRLSSRTASSDLPHELLIVAVTGLRNTIRFVAPLAHPWARWSGIQGADGQFSWFQAAVGHNMRGVSQVDFGQRLRGGDSQFPMMLPLKHALGLKQILEHRYRVRLTEASQSLDGF